MADNVHAEPFARLAQQMALPQTASLALSAPLGPVPGTAKGRAWFAEEDEDHHFPQVIALTRNDRSMPTVRRQHTLH